MSEETIKCPFCRGGISSEVKKCMHCGEWLGKNKRGISIVWKIILAIFLLLVIIFVVDVYSSLQKTIGKKTDDGGARTQSNGGHVNEKKEETKIYREGEPVQIGNFIYIVKSATGETEEDIKKIIGQAPDGKYKFLFIGANNISKESRYVDNNMFKIIDNKGRIYSTSATDNAILNMRMGSKNELFLKQVNPSVTVMGNVVFDVAKDAEGLRLEVSGGFGSPEKAYIELQ